MIDLVVIRLEEVTTFMDNRWLSEIGYIFLLPFISLLTIYIIIYLSYTLTTK